MHSSSEALNGVVAIVSVGEEARALPLRVTLSALGATVVSSWNLLVTHLVWDEGGCRTTRARARAQATQLVSPLWVEACAEANKRLPERNYPAAPRPSDLPSPRTMKNMLKIRHQIKVVSLAKSAERSTDTSATTSGESEDIEKNVNTAPRRALPMSLTPTPQRGRRRKLFTQRELTADSTDSEDEQPTRKRNVRRAQTQTLRKRSELARAGRMAKQLVAACTPTRHPIQTIMSKDGRPRIVLTGMSREERRKIFRTCLSLNAKMQKRVNRKTTHVVVGSFGRYGEESNSAENLRSLSALEGAVRGCRVLRAQWVLDSLDKIEWVPYYGYEVPHLKNLAQKAFIERRAFGLIREEYAFDVFNCNRIKLSGSLQNRNSAIHLLALCGAIVYDQNGDVIANGNLLQNGRRGDVDKFDVTIGSGPGEVDSRWIFDSVAAGRMRNVRRYITQWR